jgi:threonine dehydratase
MGLAGALQERGTIAGKRVLVILCGANIDFLQLGQLAVSDEASGRASKTISVKIDERPGTMLGLLDTAFAGFDIVDFQYGKTDAAEAWPTFTLQAADEFRFAELPSRLEASGLPWRDLTDAVDVRFRAIPLRSDLLAFPVFLRLDFYERPGALHDFLQRHVGTTANLCYFNYRQSGERIGRALIGIDFPDATKRDRFAAEIPSSGEGYRLCAPLDAEATARLTGTTKS